MDCILTNVQFQAKPNGRVEDSLIAYTWRKFMDDGGKDHSTLLLAPMVKAAVLAMNATSDILNESVCAKTNLSPGYPCREVPVDRWALAGGSKLWFAEVEILSFAL